MSFTLKQTIEALVVEELQGLLVLESFRGFNIRVFKGLNSPDERVEYAQKYLPKLGKGGSRIVFGWKAGKVLKISYDDHANSQTRQEVDFYTKPGMAGLLAGIVDFDPKYSWVIVEAVKTFADNDDLMAKLTPSLLILEGIADTSRHASGGDENFAGVMREALLNHNNNWKEFSYQTTQQDLSMGDFSTLDTELFRKLFEASRRGIIDINRYDHWGVTSSGKVVIIDYGLGRQ